MTYERPPGHAEHDAFMDQAFRAFLDSKRGILAGTVWLDEHEVDGVVRCPSPCPVCDRALA